MSSAPYISLVILPLSDLKKLATFFTFRAPLSHLEYMEYLFKYITFTFKGVPGAIQILGLRLGLFHQFVTLVQSLHETQLSVFIGGKPVRDHVLVTALATPAGPSPV